MKTLLAILALGTMLVAAQPARAWVSVGFGVHAPGVFVATPYYGAPAYYPPPYGYPVYGPPVYAVPVVPYGYPIGYRGAWRTDYPAWSPGPRGYRWR